MCTDLVDAVAKLHPQIKRMVNGGKINAKTALEDYFELLDKIKTTLEIHVGKDIFTRLASHWDVKEKIKEFHIKRDRIIERMGLDFQEEAADRHEQVSNSIEAVIKRERLIAQQAKEEFEELQKLVKTSFQTLREGVSADITSIVGSEAVTTLSDIKFQIKYGQEQSDKERQFLIETLNDVAKIKGIKSIPSLSAWYISRADIRFDTNPFASNETRSLHLGTLSSSAKVAVKVVDAAEDNSVEGDWFGNEVSRWYPLRHPNVLPLYEACTTVAGSRSC